jgi:outer membrane protein TolC
LKEILLISLVVLSHHSFGSVNELFLTSLNSSKEIEIIKLSKEKVLSDLETTTSTLFPSINLVNSHKYGNNGINSIEKDDEIDSQLALSLQHKLFQGGAEFSINDYKKIIPKQAETQKEQGYAQYYSQFSSLYFQVSSSMKEKRTIEALLKNLRDRVSIVQNRTQIGRDRKADLYALESQLFRLEAELHTSAVQLKSAKTNFLNYSGLPATVKIENTLDPMSLVLTKEVELNERPELKNLEFNVESSRLEAKMEKSSYFPQVDLTSNYYLDKYSPGRNDWDVSVNISLNLLDFGKRSSSVQSKNVTASIDRVRYDYAKLNSIRVWNKAVDNFNSKKNELLTLKKALEKIKISYNEQLKDVKRGLITQIEVIRSLDDVISLEKLVIKSALEVNLLYFQAQAYLGKYPKG